MTQDMSQVIQPKSDQINADDMIGGPMTVTITGVKIAPGTEQPVSMTIAGTAKVYRPCKSMARVMVQAWGADAKAYIGRSLTLYRDPKVKWGGLEVGGIRISHMSDIDRELIVMLTMSKANRAPAKIKPLATPAAQAAPSAPDNALDLAKAAATGGTAAFRTWWGSDEGKACRAAANANIDMLKQIAADADMPPDDDDAPPM
jgi:hypothetical protein